MGTLNYIKKLTNSISKQVTVGDIDQKISYSQSGEDLIVKFLFDSIGTRKPTFIDIGAHHPTYISNTALLYKLGSKGINIEPDPTLFKEFVRMRKRDINLNVGIGNITGRADFFVMEPPTLNTFSKKEADRYVRRDGFKLSSKVTLPITTVREVINTYSGGVFPDFLSLDVEGLDFRVIESIDFEHSFPKVICVETVSYSGVGEGLKQRELIKYIENHGYELYADTFINSIFVRKTIRQIRK